MSTTTQLCKFLAVFILFGTATLSPSVSSAQCPDATIRIEILTDNYPAETFWDLTDRNTGATISSDDLSISGVAGTLYTWDVCVSATGCYAFNIHDVYGDGICCSEGFGYYNVYFNNTLVGNGSSFFYDETVDSIGGCTAAGCPSGTMVLQLFTDQYPADNSWQLKDSTGTVVASDDLSVGGTSNTLYTWNTCVNRSSCYEFTILDSYGDGICCGFGNGYYNLYLDGSLLKTGGTFGASESSAVGSCQLSGTCGACLTGIPPANDACSGATNLGILTAPTPCPGGLGTAQTFNGSTFCATAEFPYSYIIGCQTGGDMSAPAADVWYRFQITGTVLDVQLNSQMRGVNIGLWQDAGAGCTGLVARNCAETTLGGNLSTSFTALNPGIYYMQISGMDTLDQCNFTLTLTNNQDCAACIQQNNLTAFPAPVNGRYQAGTTVTFTYVVSDYNKTAVNWIHGIVPHFGAGWDLSTLTNQIPPQSCDVNGTWGWYNRVITGSFRGISDGPGFFFESSLGCPLFCDPTDPGDNYGDSGVDSTCQLTFKWTITTTASCPPGQTGDDLGIEIFNYGDSETGSWTDPACDNDPNYQFFARLFCCDSSTITARDVSCNGGNNGSITVLGHGFIPYNYDLLNQSGTVLQSSVGDTGSHAFTGLGAGNYQIKTTDANNCTSIQDVTLASGAPLSVTANITNATCNGSSNGAIDITVSGGVSPYTYDWGSGITSEDRTGLPAGTYTVVGSDVNQCTGSNAFVVGQRAAIPNTIVPAQICAGQSYFAGGAFQTTPGTYFDSLLTVDGCDSVVQTELTVLPTTSESIVVSICDGESYFAGGAFQTVAGVYFDTVPGSNGCDSIVETTLIVNPLGFQAVSASICNGDSFFVAGDFQTVAGVYYDTLSTVNGCDSIVETTLNVTPGFVENQAIFICQGDSFFAGGAFQTTSGIYVDSFTSAGGCDSTVTTVLTVGNVVIENATANICNGDSLFLAGAFQTTSGIYTDSFQTASGCDSLLITALTVLPTFDTTLTVSICQGETYFAGGADQTTSGTYVDVYASSNGCDSTATTELTVLPVSVTNTPVSICAGDSVFAGGDFQTVSGIYSDTLTSSNGCDSIINTDLTVLPVSATTVPVSICDGESYFAGGADQTTSGTYVDVFTALNGCDSTVTTELTVLPNAASSVAATICDGQSYFAGGAFQTAKGTYYDTLVAANGCDSVVTTELDVLPTSFTTQTASICDGDSYFAGGGFQTVAGTYYDTLVAANGCDSVVATDLSIIPPSQGFTSASICEGDSYFVGGADQTQAGFYTDTLTGSNGCDSILTTQLIVIPRTGGNTQVSICDGDSYFVGGADQTTSGFYVDTLVGSNGCDSILTTELIVLSPSFGNTVVSICDGDSYFVGGADQTTSGFYVDTLTAANGCDSILTTQLIVLPSPTFTQSFTLCAGEGVFAGGAFQTTSGTYFDTVTTSGGCDSIVITNLTVGDPMEVDFTVHHVACGCTQGSSINTTPNGSGNAIGNSAAAGCAADISRFAHGEIVTGAEIAPGVTVTGISNTPSQFPNAVAVFNSNVTGSLDDDLEVDIGNLLILPQYLTDNNHDGNIDNPSDGANGGKMIFTFDRDRTVFSLTLVDNDRNNGTVKAYDANNNLIVSVGTPTMGPASIQLVNINASGVRRLEVSYWDSRGVTNLMLDCPPPPAGCGLNLSSFAHGNIISGQTLSDGITVTGTSNSSQYPNAVAIFNSNLTNTFHDDLEVGIGNLLIFPLSTTDNNGDGVIDNLRDSPAGGTMAFNFDRDRTVVSITIVDNDFAGTVIKVYGGNNNLLQTIPVAASTLPAGTLHYETIPINVSGARKVTVSYSHKLAVTGLVLDCPPPGCGLDLSGPAHGFIINNTQYASQGITVTGVSNDPAHHPNAVAIYNSDLTGTANSDMEVNLGNLLILPNDLNDANNDGILDAVNDSWAGGTMTFTFDRDRTVVSVTLVDNDRPGTVIRAYGANNNLLQTVNAPAPNLPAGAAHFETYTLNQAGVRRLEVSYTFKMGVTALILDCPGQDCCTGNATASTTGGFPPYSYTWSTGSTAAFSGDSLCVGVYHVTVTDQHGCSTTDSVRIVHAEVTTATATICQGDSILLAGEYQTTSGTYTDTIGINNGCYSLLETTLTVLPASSTTVQVTICAGQSYFAGGADQTTSGTYVDVFTAANGCDSTITTELTVLPAFTAQVDAQICQGQSYFAGGAFQTTSGTYVDSFTTASGCDSIITTVLTVLPAFTAQTNVQICQGQSYFAGGAFQTTSGTYVDSFTTTGGCDSILTTVLTVVPTAPQNVSVSICAGDSIFAGGAFQTQAGTYVDSFVSASGCDSIIVTELSVSTLALAGIVSDATCFGSSDGAVDITVTGGLAPYTFAWSNGAATEDLFGAIAGNYDVTVTDAAGCSATLGFTVNQPAELALGAMPTPATCNGNNGSIDLFVAGGIPPYTYLWNTGDTTEDISGLAAGFDTVTVTDAHNCQAILIVEVLGSQSNVFNTQVTICDGDSFFAGGAFQTVSGTYVDTLTASSGCDSLIITELTVTPASTANTAATICQGESYFAGGAFQTQSGFYFDTLQSSNGCDSILVTELTVLPASNTTTQVTICDGDSFFAGGAFQTVSGTYIDSFTSANGCDSLIITELTVQLASTSNVPVSICDGQSYFAGGDFQTQSGFYFDTLTSAAGCDSIVITELTVLQSLTTNVPVVICAGDSVFAGGDFQTASGTYLDTLVANGGCDSVIITELTVLPATTDTVNAVICAGDSLFAGGDFQTVSGTYVDTLQTAAGCDSIVITELTVIAPVVVSTQASICTGDSLLIAGQFQHLPGIYRFILANAFGCDSTVELELFVTTQLSTTRNISICTGDSVFAGGAFQTTTGVYFDTLGSSGGCDSVIQTNLVVSGLDASGVVSGVSCFGGSDGFINLTVQGGIPPFTFQWSNNTSDPNPSGLSMGAYSVTVSDANGCHDSTGFFIDEPAPLALGATTVPASCNGESDGSIDLTVLGGNPPYTYDWSTGDSIEDISGLPAAFYTVLVTDSTACQATVIVQLLEPDAIMVQDSITDETNPGSNDGAIDITVTGGTTPYVYLWSTGDTTEDISGIGGGTYFVTITDANGCSVVDSFTVITVNLRQSGVNQGGRDGFDLFAYPNPFSNNIIVKFNADADANGRLILRDVLGRKVYERKIEIKKGLNEQQLKLNGDMIATGIYMLEIMQNDDKVRGLTTLFKE